MLFLGERLRKLRWFAVALAAIGVGIQLVVFGSVPIVAIALATSFGFMVCCVKIQVDAQTGLFLETLFMLPAAAIYLIWLADTPTSDMALNSWQLNLLLVCAGVVTT